MKVALFTGGLPRFTVDFLNLMDQLKGFDSADIFISLWKTDWANTNELARNKIEKILKPKYNLARIEVVDTPQINFPSNKLNYVTNEFGGVNWYYYRRVAQLQSLRLAYNLINEEYDYIIRFRVDGQLNKELNLNNIDLKTNNLIIPKNGCGYPQWLINDQFSIGTYSSISFYKTIAEDFDKLMYESDPTWELNPHGNWSCEHLIGYYLNKNNVKYVLGNFDHMLCTQGRSKYTDKHYHLPITKDITE